MHSRQTVRDGIDMSEIIFSSSEPAALSYLSVDAVNQVRVKRAAKRVFGVASKAYYLSYPKAVVQSGSSPCLHLHPGIHVEAN